MVVISTNNELGEKLRFLSWVKNDFCELFKLDYIALLMIMGRFEVVYLSGGF